MIWELAGCPKEKPGTLNLQVLMLGLKGGLGDRKPTCHGLLERALIKVAVMACFAVTPSSFGCGSQPIA